MTTTEMLDRLDAELGADVPAPSTTDRLGFTESEWERMWESETATATAHFSRMDDENFCEVCNSPVTYSGPTDNYGTCQC